MSFESYLGGLRTGEADRVNYEPFILRQTALQGPSRHCREDFLTLSREKSILRDTRQVRPDACHVKLHCQVI